MNPATYTTKEVTEMFKTTRQTISELANERETKLRRGGIRGTWVGSSVRAEYERINKVPYLEAIK